MLPIWFTSDHPVSFVGHSPVVFQGRRDVPEMNPAPAHGGAKVGEFGETKVRR
jgi:hypothetical protein